VGAFSQSTSVEKHCFCYGFNAVVVVGGAFRRSPLVIVAIGATGVAFLNSSGSYTVFNASRIARKNSVDRSGKISECKVDFITASVQNIGIYHIPRVASSF
jgi:hypothetical protein